MVACCFNEGMKEDLVNRRREGLAQMVAECTRGNQAAFAELVGRKASQISDMLMGRKSFGEKVARYLEERAGYPDGWLDLDRPARALEDDKRAEKGDARFIQDTSQLADRRGISRRVDDPIPSNVTEGPSLTRIPVISWVQAGDFCEAVGPEQLVHADEWIDVPTKGGPNTYALRVQGDSMEPKFSEGSILVVDPDRQAVHGSFVIAKQNGECTFKQLIKDGPDWYLKPMNERYPVKQMTEDMAICGVVVMSVQTWA